jgi:hypothetical protein
MRKRLHVKYQLILSDFHKTWIFQHIFEKSLNIKFHQNPSSESQVAPYEDGRIDGERERQTGITNLMAAFRNFWNAPKNRIIKELKKK